MIIRKIVVLLFLLLSYNNYSFDRFPRPEFESDYQLPKVEKPRPRNVFFKYLDVLILILSLTAATLSVHRYRKRSLIFFLSFFSVIYFGFIKKGCVCPMGSIQNILRGLFTEDAIPITVVLFFFIPIIFTLFYGRVFCSSICPLGAIQDLFLIKPIDLPYHINRVINIFPFITLGLTVIFAINDGGFLICSLDPFITTYRFSGNFINVLYTFIFSLLSTMVARPFCRLLCPYGVTLGILSYISKHNLKISPKECISCRLCEKSCPLGAIEMPKTDIIKEKREIGVKRIIILFCIIPILITVSIFSGNILGDYLSIFNKDIKLANLILNEKGLESDKMSLEVRNFYSSERTESDLFQDIVNIRKKFQISGRIFLLFIFSIIWLKIFNLSIIRKTNYYYPNRLLCVNCGRCFESCPQGRNNG